MNFIKVIFILLATFGCQIAFGQHSQITIGEKINFHSDILNEDREIWIHYPGESSDSLYAPKQYPVLYLLDGDAHFYSVMGMMRQLSSVNGNTVLPKMIIVGITNNNRMLDLTPTSVSDLFGRAVQEGSTGRGDLFLDFMENELIPYVEKNYHTSPNRTFVGHSLGGLMVIHTLLSRPELFNNYLAIDPSLWWDNQLVLKNAELVFSKPVKSKCQLYLAIANTIGDNTNRDDIMKDTSEMTEHFRSIQIFANNLDKIGNQGINFSWDYYPDDDHGSVPLIAEYNGLRFFHDMFRIQNLEMLFDPESTLTSEEKRLFIEKHFLNLSDKVGYEILPFEDLVNQMAYGFMQNEMMETSEVFFKWNIDLYPESANVYDSLGDLYAAKSDIENAIAMYRIAIKMKNHPASVQKLKKMQEK